MVQWDKDSCADAGFLKIDLLGLGMLSAVERCVEQIARAARGDASTSRGSRSTTAETYEAIQDGRDDGRLPDREPRADGLAAAHAAREPRRPHDPGRDRAAGADRRRRGQPVHRAPAAACARTRASRCPTTHPSLEPVLRETLGTIIFQDQVLEVAQASRGFSPGRGRGAAAGDEPQALGGGDRGLPRALRRRARWSAHADVDAALAERVWTMVVGFSGFGFPKAHGAAFGLLAYQSTWLRVHYAPEFLCALLDEQPMGFYPPDALVHEAQRRGHRGAAAGRQRQRGGLHGRPDRAAPAVRRRAGLRARACARTRSPRSSPSASGRRPVPLARRTSPRAAGAGRPALEQLAWSGACDAAGADGAARVPRRSALWQLGVAAPGVPVGEQGTQLALALTLAAAPELPRARRLGRG